MTPEEIVKRLRGYLFSGGLFSPDLANHNAVRDLIRDAADLSEQQAKALAIYRDMDVGRMKEALSECQRQRAELFDQLRGTPCEQIRHAQEVEELKKALEEAEKAREHSRECQGLHHAYLRLREIIPDAFRTPFAPSPETVWAHTESCAKAVVERAEAAERELAELKRKMREPDNELIVLMVDTYFSSRPDTEDEEDFRAAWLAGVNHLLGETDDA